MSIVKTMFQLISECEEFARWIYRDCDGVDYEGAVSWWSGLPMLALEAERDSLRERVMADNFPPSDEE